MPDPPFRPSQDAEAEVTEPKLARDEGPPQAEGALETTPFVYILVFLLGRSLSGRLTLRDPAGGTILMRFRQGAPVAVEMSAHVALLGELLAEQGLLAPDETADTVARAAGRGLRLGECLVQEGRVPGGLVTELLEEQVERRCTSLVSLPAETRFTFHARRPSPPRRFEPWDPMNALLATVRAWSDRRRIHATVRWLANKPLGLHPKTQLDALKLTAAEAPAFDAMRSGSPTLESLYAEHGEGLSSLLYTLAVTRQFAFGTDKGPPMAIDRPVDRPSLVEPEPSPPPPTAQAVAARPAPFPTPVVRDLPPARPPLATVPDGFDVGSAPMPTLEPAAPAAPAPPSQPPQAPPRAKRTTAVYAPPPPSPRTPTPAPRSPTPPPRSGTPSPRPSPSPPSSPPYVSRKTGPLRMPTGETAEPPPAEPVVTRKTGPLPAVAAQPHDEPRARVPPPIPPTVPPAPASLPDTMSAAPAPEPTTSDMDDAWPSAPPSRPADDAEERPSVHAPAAAPSPEIPLGPPSFAPTAGDTLPPIAPMGISQSIAFIDHGEPPPRPAPEPPRPPPEPAGPRPLPPPPPLVLGKPPNLAVPKAPPSSPSPASVRPAAMPRPVPGQPPARPVPANPAPRAVSARPPPHHPPAPPPAPAAPPARFATSGNEDPKAQAREEYRLAEEALERGELDAADSHALAAVRLDAKSPEYAALQVWIAAKINVELPEAVRSFSRILDDHPECEPALYYRGMLLKEAGKDRAALRDFVTLVRLNPDHLKGLVEVKALRARMPKP